jgi:dTDP-4-dehydrorhamnose 3,5-epimerase
MNRIETALPGVCILEPRVFGDNRGYFLEFYSERAFSELGISHRFVQDNHSRSSSNVLRGLHYQIGRPQAKMVRVIQGTVYDVAVDIRRGSPTFGRWIGEILSAENKRMLFIPEGFAHGFYVISDTAEFIYKCSDFYSPADERGVIWKDPDLKIDWPLQGRTPALSGKDQAYGTLATRPEKDLPVYSA